MYTERNDSGSNGASKLDPDLFRERRKGPHPLYVLPEHDRRQTYRPVSPAGTLRAAMDRTMVHWVLTYLAAAWIILQLMDVLNEIWNMPLHVQRFICIALALGLMPALVVAWFHGEEGPQKVTGMEASLVGALLFGSGTALWMLFGI